MEVLGARKGLVDWLISLQDGHLGSLLAYWFIRGPSNVISTDLFGGIGGGIFPKKNPPAIGVMPGQQTPQNQVALGTVVGVLTFTGLLFILLACHCHYSSILLKTD